MTLKGMDNLRKRVQRFLCTNIRSISAFLDRPVLDLAAEDKLGSPLKAALLYAVLALGVYLLGDELPTTDPAYNPRTLLNAAMELRLKFTREDEFSLRHLQVFSPQVQRRVDLRED